MKKIVIITLCAALLFTVFPGCSPSSANAHNGSNGQVDSVESKALPRRVLDLTGNWKQIGSKYDDPYQAATIRSNTIEIYWVSDNGNTKSLYWVGTFVAPTVADEPYRWNSKNDHRKTENAVLASNDEAKTMTYQNGVLSYEASAMGTTTTIKLEKQK